MTASRPNVAAPDRASQVRRVVEETLNRRARGEVIADEAVCQEHLSLLPELAAELEKLRVIARARNQVQRDAARATDPTAETAAFVPSGPADTRLASSLHIRCPLCHEPLEIVADQALDDVPCIHCGGHFALAGDDPALGQQAVTKIAHFELLQRLGMGGFGTVWKARDTELGRIVALKIPRRRLLNAGEEEQFLYEARVAAGLRHPNIVTVHEIGRDGDHAYIVSDFVEGVSLDQYRVTHGLTQRDAAELLATVCDALHFAHRAGIVHRDLKPGNILVNAAGQPFVTDFGLAKRSHEEVAVTIHGEILGTPAYMPPEQARGEGHQADGRTDVYALGVILFELLTDELPFRGNAVMLLHHAAHTQPPSPRSLVSSVSRDLETICLKCLEKDPQRRFASAEELAAELRRFVAGDEILSRPMSHHERLWRWCQRNPRIPALSAALLAVVLVSYAFAWLWFERQLAATDAALTERALANLQFTAESIARTAGHDFEQYYTAVEEAAQDEVLRGELESLLANGAFVKEYEPLYDRAKSDEELDPLRQQLRDDARRQALQSWIDARPLTGELPVFAWFVLLPDGLQIVRNPLDHGGSNTIGEDYAWRAYFHGGDRDHPRERGSGRGRHLRNTHLSPPFLTEHTSEWVVVISTPIYGRVPQEQAVVGVLGLMIRLGELATLPGDAPSGVNSPANRFAVVMDARAAQAGQILQHPLYAELEDEPAARKKLLERAQDAPLRMPKEAWEIDADYRDPFAAVDRRYDQRWLAARLPLLARGQDTQLRVVVQESYDETIGQPLAQMRHGLIVLSLVTLALSAALTVPLWALILRLVQ